MKIVKRITSYVLSISMALGILAVPSFAVNLSNNDLSQVNCVMGTKGFNEIFESNNESYTSFSYTDSLDENEEVTNVNATYSYSITNVDDSNAYVDLSFTLISHNGTNSVELSGNVPKLELETMTLIKGFLTGNTTINGIDFIVDVGFTAVEGGTDASFGVSLTEANYTENNNATATMFCFGTPVLVGNVLDEYTAYKENINSNNADNQPVIQTSNNVSRSASDFSLFGSAYGDTIPVNNYTDDGTGQRLVVAVDDQTPRIACSLKSYTSYFHQSEFSYGTFIAAYVNAYQIGLRRVSGNAFISNTSGVSNLPSGTSQSYNLYSSLFANISSDILSYFGIPASTLSSIFRYKSGEIKIRDDADHYYVHVSLDGQDVSFDNTPVPLDFYLVTNGYNSGVFDAYTYLTYEVDTMESALIVRTTTATVDNIPISPN